MISEIQIGNFKAFGPVQTIPLRPITLVFGPNSAGKSSIIHSLLLARHIYDTGKPDAHKTTLGGAAMDLGGFARYVHQHQTDRDTTICLAFKRADIVGKFHFADDFETLKLAYQIGMRDSDHGQDTIIKSVTLFVDNDELLRLVWTNDGIFRLDRDAFEARSWLAEFHLGNQTELQGSLTTARDMLRVSGAEKFVEIACNAGLSLDGLLDPVTGQPTLKGCLALLRRLYRKTTEDEMKTVVPPDIARGLAEREEDSSKTAVIDEFANAKFRVSNLVLANLDPLTDSFLNPRHESLF